MNVAYSEARWPQTDSLTESTVGRSIMEKRWRTSDDLITGGTYGKWPCNSWSLIKHSGDCFIFLYVRLPSVATPFCYSALVPHCLLHASRPLNTINRVTVISFVRAVYYWLYLLCYMCFVRISRLVNYFASHIAWLFLNPRGLED